MTADEAYANSAYIPDGEGYYARWEAAAEAFRATSPNDLAIPYGSGARQTFDLFYPDGGLLEHPAGTVIFVHGGYWMAGSAQMFSHLATGAVAQGCEYAAVNYSLAPDVRITDITQEIRAAIGVIAGRTKGAIYLVGHSAGGHLVARMACADMAADWSRRVCRVMAISPLGDLAPLMDTSMNETLGIDAAEARAESPVLHTPQDIPVTVWVGGAERPAFLDQAGWLAEKWGCDLTVEAEKHHFDVIEGLEDPVSPMMRALFR